MQVRRRNRVEELLLNPIPPSISKPSEESIDAGEDSIQERRRKQFERLPVYQPPAPIARTTGIARTKGIEAETERRRSSRRARKKLSAAVDVEEREDRRPSRSSDSLTSSAHPAGSNIVAATPTNAPEGASARAKKDSLVGTSTSAADGNALILKKLDVSCQGCSNAKMLCSFDFPCTRCTQKRIVCKSRPSISKRQDKTGTRDVRTELGQGVIDLTNDGRDVQPNMFRGMPNAEMMRKYS